MTLNKDKCVQNSVVLMMNGMKTGLKNYKCSIFKRKLFLKF
jgi:hypothetical protein